MTLMKKSWWNEKISKNNEVNRCNQQWKHPKTIVKLCSEEKTSEETMMKNPKELS